MRVIVLPGHKGFDIDRWTWHRKKKYWLHKPMTIVTGSRWLADCAQKSYLFRDKRVQAIPSGLDINVYKPVDKRIRPVGSEFAKRQEIDSFWLHVCSQ